MSNQEYSYECVNCGAYCYTLECKYCGTKYEDTSLVVVEKLYRLGDQNPFAVIKERPEGVEPKMEVVYE